MNCYSFLSNNEYMDFTPSVKVNYDLFNEKLDRIHCF